MSRRRIAMLASLLACMLVVGALWLLKFRSVPTFLETYPIDQAFVEHCTVATEKGESWVRSAGQVAMRYRDRRIGDTRPGRTRDASVRFQSATLATVTIHDKGCFDDSVDEAFSKYHLRLQNGGWIPYRVERARKGRGRFGWTTKPTL